MAIPRILLADDQPEVLENIAQALDGGFDIVGAVQNGQLAIEAVARLDPDVIVLDITMPVMDGIEVARHLQKSASRARMVFLTIHEDQDYVDAAFSVGALGYVLKARLTVDLVPAIREVLNGRPFVSPPLAKGNDTRG